MFAIFPTLYADDANRLISAIENKGHFVTLLEENKPSFFDAWRKGSVFIAYGKLPPISCWMWGYANAVKRKVISIKGVAPVFAAKSIPLEKWLDELPEQLTMF